jgi:ferredoxin
MSLVTTKNLQFSLLPGESLLEGLERTGHQVEYQCRSGYCGMCRVPLVHGEVTYREQPLAFVNPGEILPCCCQVSGHITVDCVLETDQENQFELFREDLFDQR